ncbi:MAG TPA: response regulator [Azospirillaceae bacterium]|nr:response regulator [Azospirillaceae bacterium]
MKRSSGSTGHILVVDDSPTNRLLVAKLLAKAGFRVMAAEDGGEALALALTASPDLILMDIAMPGIDGLKAAALIRRGPEDVALTPIIAMSANTDDGDRAACAAAGMNDFLPKPFATEDLLATVGRWIAGQPAVAEAAV